MKTIKRGSSGPEVAHWQTILQITADGKFGPGTESATKAWQSKNGLTPDGIVGPLTWAAAETPTITSNFKKVGNFITNLNDSTPLWQKIVAVFAVGATILSVAVKPKRRRK